jgi:hypothetical protein
MESYKLHELSLSKIFDNCKVLVYGDSGDLLVTICEMKGDNGTVITSSNDFDNLVMEKGVCKVYSQLFKKRIFRKDSYLFLDNINVPIMQMRNIKNNMYNLSNFLFINSVGTDNSVYFNTKLQDCTIDYHYIVVSQFNDLGEIYHKYIHSFIIDYSHFLYILEVILSEGNLFVFDTVKNIIGFVEIY